MNVSLNWSNSASVTCKTSQCKKMRQNSKWKSNDHLDGELGGERQGGRAALTAQALLASCRLQELHNAWFSNLICKSLFKISCSLLVALALAELPSPACRCTSDMAWVRTSWEYWYFGRLSWDYHLDVLCEFQYQSHLFVDIIQKFLNLRVLMG